MIARHPESLSTALVTEQAGAKGLEETLDYIPVNAVRIDGGTQSRAELSQSTIAEYAEAIRLAVELPPVVMFFDGVHFWLADGFHRFHAHREAGAAEIAAEIRVGTQRDAVLFSVGANASHGLRRSNEDKRKAVEILLADPEWATWSNNAIAKACAVSDKTVAAYRAEHLRKSEDSQATPAVRTVERNGATYEQNTARIGPSRVESGSAQASTVATSVDQSSAAINQAAGTTCQPDPKSPPPLSASPSKEPQPDVTEAPAPGDEKLVPASEVEQLRGQVAELAADLEKTIADNVEMGRVFEADDRLKAAMGEIARYKAAAASAKQSLDSKMGENNELIRTVKSLRGQLERETKRADDAERRSSQMRSAA